MKLLGKGWPVAAVLSAVLALAGCNEESPVAGSGGTSSAGEGATGGDAGMGGTGGTGGDSGTGGTGGDSGTGGTGGDSGTGGTGGDSGTGGTGGDSGTGGTGGSACTVTPPTTWSAPDFAANAAAELVLRAQLQALITRMQRGEDETAMATVLEDLTALLDAGDPSLRDAMTTTYVDVVGDVFDLFIPTVGVTLDPAVIWNPDPQLTDVGGRFCGPTAMPTSGCWNMSAGGVDLRQLVDKGAFQAALYHQAHLRASGNVTPATIDQIAALFGANDAFDVNGTNVHSSNYAKGMGYYARIRDHLIAAKAYAGEGASCQAELNQSLQAALTSWEESQVARFIFYANAGLELFATGTATNAQNAEALHDLTEGLGLVYGFKGLPTSARVITDEEIDAVLTLMKLPSVQGATLYQFLIGDADDLGDIESAFDQLQSIYNFTDTQISQFRIPTAG